MQFEKVSLPVINYDESCLPRFIYENENHESRRLSRSGVKALIESLVTEIDECNSAARWVLYNIGTFRSRIHDILNGETDETTRYLVAAFAGHVDESIDRLNKFSPAAVESTKDFQHTLRTLLPEVFIGNAECVDERRIIESAPIFYEATASFKLELESFVEWIGDWRIQICNIWTTYDAAVEEFINRAKLRAQRKQKRAERRARRYARKSSARKSF